MSTEACHTNGTFVKIAQRRQKEADYSYCIPTAITINYIDPKGKFRYATLPLNKGFISPADIKEVIEKVADDAYCQLAQYVTDYPDFLEMFNSKKEIMFHTDNYFD